MESILKYDRIILVKEMNERIKKVGEIYEVANVLDDAFVLRDSNTRTAVGVVSFEDFNKYFVKEEDFKGWTPWTAFIGFDAQNDCFYRTNGKKVQVKMLRNRVRSEASCNKKEDDFNLNFGLHIAYFRCMNKVLEEKKVELEKKLWSVNNEIAENKNMMERMIDSLV